MGENACHVKQGRETKYGVARLRSDIVQGIDWLLKATLRCVIIAPFGTPVVPDV